MPSGMIIQSHKQHFNTEPSASKKWQQAPVVSSCDRLPRPLGAVFGLYSCV
eukprot:m.100306 g.100306  ORF g.100306 m.100306 type:complete len:51 (+) comp14932_c0_seq2:504-656(+)